MSARKRRDIRERLRVLQRRTGTVIPFTAMLVIVYGNLFRIIVKYGLLGCYILEPGTEGASILDLLGAVNVLLIVYTLAQLLRFALGNDRTSLSYWASYVGALLVLVVIQIALATMGDLARLSHHSTHPFRGRRRVERRFEHYAEAIGPELGRVSVSPGVSGDIRRSSA